MGITSDAAKASWSDPAIRERRIAAMKGKSHKRKENGTDITADAPASNITAENTS